ncbi:transporter [Haloarchaeobius sp. TZWSO28]|uniref:transporter n=1 Tax=Haloarchaeobius sp. TZWSO28 TaxID=3446119 RepID=UPI003EBCEBF5
MVALLDLVMRMLHSVTAAVWAGSVLFLTLGLLPSALDGSLNASPMESIVGRFRWVTRGSAVVLFVTGGHLAGTLYTIGDGGGFSLFGSARGHLVLTMLGLWLVLTGLCEVGASKLADGFSEKKVRSPAAAAKPFLYGASLVAVALLVVAVLIVYGAGTVY